MHYAQNTLLIELPAATREKLTAAAEAAGMSVESYAAAVLTAAAKKEQAPGKGVEK